MIVLTLSGVSEDKSSLMELSDFWFDLAGTPKSQNQQPVCSTTGCSVGRPDLLTHSIFLSKKSFYFSKLEHNDKSKEIKYFIKFVLVAYRPQD